jgi:hypothetical protein
VLDFHIYYLFVGGNHLRYTTDFLRLKPLVMWGSGVLSINPDPTKHRTILSEYANMR